MNFIENEQHIGNNITMTQEKGEGEFTIALKLLAHFNNSSIRFKLFFYFFIIIILCIMTLSFFGGEIYKKSIEKEANRHTDQMIDQVWNHIKVLIQENDNIMYYLANEESVGQFLEQKKPAEKIEQKAKEKIQIYKDRHQEIAGIILVNRYDQLISNEMTRISRDPLTKESWYKKAIQTPGKIQLISKPIGRNLTNTSDYQVNNVLSLVKAIENPTTKEVEGVILIDLKFDFIKSVIESIKLGKSGFIFIMDKESKVVYSPVNSTVYRIHPSWLANDESPPIEKEIEHDKFQIIYNTVPDIGWKIVGVFSINETTKVVSKVQGLTLIIAIITLIISLIVSLFFANTITKPLTKLKTLMGNVEERRFDLRFHSKYDDEIGQLGNSYNKMIQEVEELIDLVYKEQKSKREAELKILQAQIKPHFLYNTLDTIQWMASEYKADKIIEMVNALTTLFRIGLNKGNEFITVEEEVEHIVSYLTIQMTRYESKIGYQLDVDETVKNNQVLKLILQPLVENAIYHGIRNKRGKGKISISICKRNDQLLFAVRDTGVGIEAEPLKKLNHALKNMSGDHKGYGLFNVNERILLSYGSQYGLQVFSEYGTGTTVIAILPIINK
ncbi:sensor histidine kinase [Peribacillus sp. FSL E2-0218]|uniref:cache domain-containing sensor histidine kinase n=1 Tax=Peribacillus sp. FSL E2-0218 TaxID=2921364 RepID=UPI0030EEE45D